jgi:hypothetical protein
MSKYEVNIDGKWCIFEPGGTDNFDTWCPNESIDLEKCDKVYGRAIISYMSYMPCYQYFSFPSKSIRVIKKAK